MKNDAFLIEKWPIPRASTWAGVHVNLCYGPRPFHAMRRGAAWCRVRPAVSECGQTAADQPRERRRLAKTAPDSAQNRPKLMDVMLKMMDFKLTLITYGLAVAPLARTA